MSTLFGLVPAGLVPFRGLLHAGLVLIFELVQGALVEHAGPVPLLGFVVDLPLLFFSSSPNSFPPYSVIIFQLGPQQRFWTSDWF